MRSSPAFRSATISLLRLAVAALSALSAAAGGACSSAPPAQTTLSRDVRIPPAPRLPDGRGGVIGVVADATTGFPVLGAAVYFTTDPLGEGDPPPSRSDLPSDSTDARGAFVLAPLAPGTYTVAVRRLGYVSERRVVAIRPGVVDSVIVRLREQVRLTR